MAAEAAATLLLFRRRNEAVKHGVAFGYGLDGIAGLIQGASSKGITDLRAVSRSTGLTRIRAEAQTAGVTLEEADAVAVAHAEVLRDVFRANSISSNYSRAWLGKANAAEADSTRAAASFASAETRGSVLRIAVTESAEAFNDGRAKYIRRASAHSALGLLRVWDATLDKRTCPVCEAADGTIVGVNEHFPAGEPGSVHPWDRCTFGLLHSSEDAEGTLISPDDPQGTTPARRSD